MYMTSIECMNNLSNFYEYLYRKEIIDNKYRKENINIPKNINESDDNDNDNDNDR